MGHHFIITLTLLNYHFKHKETGKSVTMAWIKTLSAWFSIHDAKCMP